MKKSDNIARILRKRPIDAEKLLWRHLRAKQMNGFKFRRQQPIDNCIVDFASFENRIIIKVDGGQHAVEKERDIERDNYLKRHGFKILRSWNNDVLTNISGVLEVIKENCLSHPPLTPPVKGGEDEGGSGQRRGSNNIKNCPALENKRQTKNIRLNKLIKSMDYKLRRTHYS
ncbi:MAG: endonuclease domain-containing protein [Deltaproteobacteria bacterium]|nr:endonuclease domain-containing protein [Deltaproteobacteria bacterium]